MSSLFRLWEGFKGQKPKYTAFVLLVQCSIAEAIAVTKMVQWSWPGRVLWTSLIPLHTGTLGLMFILSVQTLAVAVFWGLGWNSQKVAPQGFTAIDSHGKKDQLYTASQTMWHNENCGKISKQFGSKGITMCQLHYPALCSQTCQNG